MNWYEMALEHDKNIFSREFEKIFRGNFLWRASEMIPEDFCVFHKLRWIFKSFSRFLDFPRCLRLIKFLATFFMILWLFNLSRRLYMLLGSLFKLLENFFSFLENFIGFLWDFLSFCWTFLASRKLLKLQEIFIIF